MKNIYKRGARKEYKIVNDLKKEGYDIVNRLAGSHSPIDVIAINTANKRIKLIQSKRTMSKTMNYINPNLKEKMETEHLNLNGLFVVSFEVR